MHRATRVIEVAVLLSFAVSGCAGGGSGPDGGETCNSDPGCDDGFECTIDTCGADNLCRHVGIDERCEDGQVCESGRGCVTSASCETDEECDDSIACTVDSCGAGNICNHITVNERCGGGETCDRTMGCIGPTGCTGDAECDDGVACTRDVCTAGGTCSHNALNELCDTAAGERCHQTRGCYVPMPCITADDCDDGDFCNGAETCTPEFGCEPAAASRTCDDGDPCTIDSCDPSLPNDSGGMGQCVRPCDSSRTECGCPTPGPMCDGRFNLPGANGTCVVTDPDLGALGSFSWNFSNVRFTNIGGAIEVTEWTVSTTGSVPPMADPGPACPNVDATTTLPGDCTENYRIEGTFNPDGNTFTGTFTATFTGTVCVLGCFECSSCNMTVPVSGTRLP